MSLFFIDFNLFLGYNYYIINGKRKDNMEFLYSRDGQVAVKLFSPQHGEEVFTANSDLWRWMPLSFETGVSYTKKANGELQVVIKGTQDTLKVPAVTFEEDMHIREIEDLNTDILKEIYSMMNPAYGFKKMLSLFDKKETLEGFYSEILALDTNYRAEYAKKTANEPLSDTEEKRYARTFALIGNAMFLVVMYRRLHQ